MLDEIEELGSDRLSLIANIALSTPGYIPESSWDWLLVKDAIFDEFPELYKLIKKKEALDREFENVWREIDEYSNELSVKEEEQDNIFNK